MCTVVQWGEENAFFHLNTDKTSHPLSSLFLSSLFFLRSLLLSLAVSSHHCTCHVFPHIPLSCLSSKAYPQFKQHLLNWIEKPSEGCNIALSLVKKKDKPDFLSLNIKPLKPFQLWDQNKKNRERVQRFPEILNWRTLGTTWGELFTFPVLDVSFMD